MPVGLHKWSSMLPNTAEIQVVDHVTGKSYVAKLILGVTCCRWSNGFEIESHVLSNGKVLREYMNTLTRDLGDS